MSDWIDDTIDDFHTMLNRMRDDFTEGEATAKHHQALKWSEVVRWLEKWGIEVENKAFDELKEIING